MKISYNWLKTYIDTEVSLDEISAVLTNIGLEVEGVEKVGGAKEYLETVVVGKVLETQPHPNSENQNILKRGLL